MDLLEVMKMRRSVRKFKDVEVSEDIINKILEGARLAPETDVCNYYFGVVDDRNIKDQIAKATLWANWVSQAPVIFVCCADIGWDIADQEDDAYGVVGNKLRYGSEIIDYLRENDNRKASKTLLLSTPAYIAAQHMILTAVSYGLRGCLVDFMNIEKINTILSLPDHTTCQVLVPVGYADEVPKKRIERDKKERTFYNEWGNMA
jgi:nitroreductase